MKELGRNEEYIFYLHEDCTKWWRYENPVNGVKSQNWHVLVVKDLTGDFKETLIMDSKTNQVIDTVASQSMEAIACKIDVLKLAYKL